MAVLLRYGKVRRHGLDCQDDLMTALPRKASLRLDSLIVLRGELPVSFILDGIQLASPWRYQACTLRILSAHSLTSSGRTLGFTSTSIQLWTMLRISSHRCSLLAAFYGASTAPTLKRASTGSHHGRSCSESLIQRLWHSMNRVVCGFLFGSLEDHMRRYVVRGTHCSPQWLSIPRTEPTVIAACCHC